MSNEYVRPEDLNSKPSRFIKLAEFPDGTLYNAFVDASLSGQIAIKMVKEKKELRELSENRALLQSYENEYKILEKELLL